MTPPPERAKPKSNHLSPKSALRSRVEGHSVVLVVPAQDSAQPVCHLWNRIVHPPAQLELNLLELCMHLCALGFAHNHELSIGVEI